MNFVSHSNINATLHTAITPKNTSLPVSDNTKSLFGSNELVFGSLADIKNIPQYIVTIYVARDSASISFNALSENGLLLALA